MPALVVFQRQWRIGSDDFVIPGIIEFVVRALWLALVVALFVQHEANTEACTDGWYLQVYLLGSIVLLLLSLLASVLMAVHSSRGSIMNAAPRKYVPHILVGRVMLGMPEVAWNILGTIWILSGLVECSKDPVLPLLIKALVIYTWVALGFLIIGVLIIFDPAIGPGGPEEGEDNFMVEGGSLGSHYVQTWERRCRFLFCCTTRDENSSEAFQNISFLFSTLFTETDMVASDVAAALVLLRLKRLAEEQREETARKNCPTPTPLSRSSTASVGALQCEGRLPLQMLQKPKWMNLAYGHHFMKYALASYGWPWFVYGRYCRASCSLWPHLFCCYSCRKSTSMAKQDNCCQCHAAAMKAVTGLNDEDFIYVTFHNKIYEVPFFVAIDDSTENIVIAIRGTLSLHDAITDMTAQCTEMDVEGLPPNCLAHKGMVQTALFVKRRLVETGALNKAFSTRPNYGLVITGHSLGAGTAALLATMLRPQFPALKCFAFSPPGGLCSGELSKAMESFVLSVIVGDDLVPRLSINALHDLRRKIISVLEGCNQPKYRVLAQGCWYMMFGISAKSLNNSMLESSASQTDPLLPSSASSYTYFNPVYGYEEQTMEDVRVLFNEDARRNMNSCRTDTPLILPGRILYCFPRLLEDERDDMTYPGEWEWQWAKSEDFSRLLISPFMLTHHFPQNVLAALQDVTAVASAAALQLSSVTVEATPSVAGSDTASGHTVVTIEEQVDQISGKDYLPISEKTS